jgi:RNA exonuclease 1
MKTKIEKLKLDDVYKFFIWFFNGRKKPNYVNSLNIVKNENLNFIILTDKIMKRFPYSGFKVKFHENIDILRLPTVFTRDVHIEEMKPNLSKITRENLKHVFTLKLEQLYDSKIFINSATELKCPNKSDFFTRKTKYFLVSIDLEMVYSKNGKEVGRVSILDNLGNVLYDKFVQPGVPIVDYCTIYSGLTPELLSKGIPKKQMKEEIREIIGKDTFILGHGLDNDMTALEIHHPHIIDTSYIFLNTESRRVSLQQLARKYLKKQVHDAAHSSIEDAKICLELLALKIQQIEQALDKNTNEIWLQAHIHHHNDLKSFGNEQENGFHVYFTNLQELKTQYKKVSDSTDVFIYREEDKIFMKFH